MKPYHMANIWDSPDEDNIFTCQENVNGIGVKVDTVIAVERITESSGLLTYSNPTAVRRKLIKDQSSLNWKLGLNRDVC